LFALPLQQHFFFAGSVPFLQVPFLNFAVTQLFSQALSAHASTETKEFSHIFWTLAMHILKVAFSNPRAPLFISKPALNLS